MAVIQASHKDIELITDMLIEEYINLNNKIWLNLYKTDKEFLFNHVRLNIDNSENWFKYFLLQNAENEFVWMMNTLIHWDKWEILIITFKDWFKNRENYSKLLHYWISYLKWKQVKYIYFESLPSEEIYIDTLNNVNAQIISNKRILTN